MSTHVLSRHAIRISWVVCVLGLVLAPITTALPMSIKAIPFVASLVLFGLPHGAVDHLVLAEWRSASFSAARMVGVVIVYLIPVALYGALWFVAPLLSAAFFIALTWFHWGQGDLYAVQRLHGAQHLEARFDKSLAVFIRGGLPMLVPLLAHPAVYLEVIDLLTVHFNGPQVLPLLPWFVEFVVPVGTVAGIIALLIYATRTWPYRYTKAWLWDIGELCVLCLFFVAVDPVIAVGLYFCLWHAIRHVVRLQVADPGDGNESAVRSLQRFAIRALPTTLGALIVLGALYFLAPSQPDDLPEWMGLYLMVISILTLPHAAVVTMMDIRERIWR
ncbi:MAG: beta-carotene 15,15'-monooxygenase [Bacteroidetes bacterium]|nr:beta-carotene 15,15'-monooxygenase [Bacteroidota bacterium]